MIEFQKLIRLATIDTSIRSFETEMDTADDGKELMQSLSKFTVEQKKIDDALALLKRKLDAIKEKYDSAKDEKDKMQKRLFSSGVNPRQIAEIQDHMKKLDELLDKLETQQLELLDKNESYTTYKTKVDKKVSSLRGKLEEILSQYKKTQTQEKIKIAELNRTREELTKSIDSGLLSLYQKMCQQKNGIGMVEVVGTLCGGCHQPISDAVDQKL